MRGGIPLLVWSGSISGILFGGLIMVLRVFNGQLEVLAGKLSSAGKCVSCSPATFEMLNISIGMALIFLSLFFVASYFHREEIGTFLKKTYLKLIGSVIAILSLRILFISLGRFFLRDELEHVHAAWYIMNSFVPYTEFFEHHHPLLWFAITPVLGTIGYSADALLWLRIAMFLATAGTAFLTYAIARHITRSPEASLLSVLFLLSTVMFVDAGIEIRPDVPQVLFGLISVYFLLLFLDREETRYIFFAGLAASVSFLFLQKSVFLLIAYCMIFLFRLIRGTMSVRSVMYFILSFSLPLFFFFVYLILSGAFRDYFLMNWLFNIHRATRIPALLTFKVSFLQNTLLWLLSLFSVIFLLGKREVNGGLKTVGFIGAVLLVVFGFAKNAAKQYCLFPIPSLCVCSGYTIKWAFEKMRLREPHKLAIIALFLSVPMSILFMTILPSNQRQLEVIDYVIKNSQETDLIYDGDVKFNLFRRDIHYFWFYANASEDTINMYNKITQNSYLEYDVCALVKTRRPVFISDFGLDMKRCRLLDLYEETRFGGLYKKRWGGFAVSGPRAE